MGDGSHSVEQKQQRQRFPRPGIDTTSYGMRPSDRPTQRMQPHLLSRPHVWQFQRFKRRRYFSNPAFIVAVLQRGQCGRLPHATSAQTTICFNGDQTARDADVGSGSELSTAAGAAEATSARTATGGEDRGTSQAAGAARAIVCAHEQVDGNDILVGLATYALEFRCASEFEQRNRGFHAVVPARTRVGRKMLRENASRDISRVAAQKCKGGDGIFSILLPFKHF